MRDQGASDAAAAWRRRAISPVRPVEATNARLIKSSELPLVENTTGIDMQAYQASLVVDRALHAVKSGDEPDQT